jgi:hypothetical protein
MVLVRLFTNLLSYSLFLDSSTICVFYDVSNIGWSCDKVREGRGKARSTFQKRTKRQEQKPPTRSSFTTQYRKTHTPTPGIDRRFFYARMKKGQTRFLMSCCCLLWSVCCLVCNRFLELVCVIRNNSKEVPSKCELIFSVLVPPITTEKCTLIFRVSASNVRLDRQKS